MLNIYNAKKKKFNPAVLTVAGYVVVVGHVLVYHAVHKALNVHLSFTSVLTITVHHHRRVD